MSRLEELRDIVRRRRAAVTAKERRIFLNTGIDLKGTREDPRRPPSVVKKYNINQLNKYLADLNNFMLRSNGYIPDASGGFIRKVDWQKYKKAEQKYNKIVQGHFENIADVLDPYRNVTIRQAEALFVPESKRAAGEIRHRPFNEISRDPRNIKSAEALAKLHAQIEGRLDKNYLPKAIKAGRSQANAMLSNAGLDSLKAVVGKLSDQQFDVLWNYWGFATRLSQIGESGGHRSKATREADRNDRLSAQDKDDIKNDIKEFVDAAKELKFDKNGKIQK